MALNRALNVNNLRCYRPRRIHCSYVYEKNENKGNLRGNSPLFRFVLFCYILSNFQHLYCSSLLTCTMDFKDNISIF